MIKHYIRLLVSAGIVFLVACDQSDRVSGPTLINTWTEIEPTDIVQYGGSTYASLRINDDSTFQLRYQEWGDIIFPEDPCTFFASYYVKGTCSTSGSDILFTGCYTDSTFNQCIASCSGEINFNAHYKYAVQVDSLIFNPGEIWYSRRDMIPE